MTKYIIPTVAEIKQNLKANGPKFEIVSFFAGGGGSSLGYRMAGGKVLAINEFVPEARNSYHANWPDTIIFPEDIRQLTPEKILDAIGKKPGELDILDGSPPCCAFSTQGKREKGWGDKVHKYSDVAQSNIEDLFFEYIRMIDGIKPKCFVAENVSGMRKGSAKGYINEVLRKIRAIGYYVECRLVNSVYLGVPQKRERVIFCGVRNDLFKDTLKGKMHPKPIPKIVTLKDAFEGIVNSKDELEFFTPKLGSKTLAQMKAGKIGKPGITFMSLRKMGPNIPSNTLTTSSNGPYHWENRYFTIAERKRIMSVPDDYILTGTKPQQVERLGRMVPPLMMKAIAENLYDNILSKC